MRNIYLLLISLSIGLTGFSQTVVSFNQRFETTQRGNIDFITNTILECNSSIGGSGSVAGKLACGLGVLDTQAPPTFTDISQNNDHGVDYIDIDSDPLTFSSSSDSIHLAPCSEILFAEIYWGAKVRTADARYANRNQIKIGVDGGAYTTITSDTLIDNTEGYDSYHCRADITDLVQSNPLQAIYTVADMYARISGTNNWGGWNIVIVYRNDLEVRRNLTVYDGVVNVEGLTDVDISIDGFITPPTGAVTFDVGVFGYDGDRGFVGDELLFDGGSGYQNIFNTTNPIDDIFNFSITKRDVVSTSQSPLILNNISIDADIFSPDNSAFDFIGNSATSAEIRLTTGGETVLSQVITLAIDVYEPDVRASVTVEDLNGGDAFPGDTLKYTVKGINIGSDPAINAFVTDTIEMNANYVPNSIEITYGPNLGIKTDAAGDDQADYDAANRTIKVRIGTGADDADGGTVLNDPTGADSTIFTFLAVIVDDCINLFCDNIVDNRAFIYATGPSSGTVFNNGSNPGVFDVDGCPIIGTTQTTVNISGCSFPPDTTVAVYCSNIEFADFPYEGYDYFDDAFAPVTEAVGVGDYYGIYEAYDGCTDTVQITVASYVLGPTVADAGADQTLCIDPGTTTLDGNEPVEGTGLWTVLAGGATIDSPTDFDSEISDLTVGVNTFQWAISTLVCPESSVDEITINVDAEPTTADAGEDQTVCEDPGTATLAGNDPAIGTGTWTLVSGTATITDASAFNSGVTGLGTGDNVFRWTVSNGVCADSFDDITITVDAAPTAANAGVDQTVCVDPGTATLAGNDPAIGTGTWTLVSGTATITDASAFNSGVTGLGAGDNVFRWTIENGVCADSFDDITITVDAAPTAANAGVDQTVCVDPGTATLAGNDPAIGTGTWTLVSGTATITDASAFNSGVTGLGAGDNVFRWTIENGVCADSFDDITITVDAEPTAANAGSDQTVCVDPGTATLDGNDPAIGTGTWTLVSGTATITDASAFNSGVTGLGAGDNVFRWTVSNGVCADSFDDITITVDAAPTAANAGADQTVCEDPGTATLAGNDPAVGTGTWTLVSGTATITDGSAFNSGVTGLGAGDNVFRWTIENGVCADSFDDITITVDAAPTAANAGADQTVCEDPGTATLAGNDPAIGTGTWTLVSGTATITDASAFNSGVTGLGAGDNVFRWTIENGVCADSFDDITITIVEEPSMANAGADQTVCEDPGTATLTGNDPAVGTGTWTLVSGTGTITDASAFNSGVTGLAAGDNVFRWTISTGGCIDSFDDITITVDAEPSTADAGPDQTVCEDPGTATLAGNNPLVGTGVWTVVAGGGTVTVPGDFNSGVTGLSAGVNTFRWTVSNGVCTDSFDEVTITMDEAPSTADAGADQEICDAPGTATLAGNDPAVGTGTWTLVSGTGTITDVSAFNSGVTALGIGDNVFRWTISNGVCADSFDEITITVNEAPTTANAGIDQTLCSDPGTATLAGNDPAIGTGVWTVITGGATVTTPADFNSGVTGLTVGVNTFRWTISNGACTDSFDEITINVDEAPTASAAGDDQELCFVTTSTLEGNDPAIGTGAWTVITGGASVTDATAFDSEVTGLTLGTNTFVWTISNGVCAVSTDTIVILITEDNDGDGVCDAEDLDSDNDGVSDIAEGDDDTDGDGIPDYLDLDSDNDGIPDLVEAGGTDADGDGLVDDFEDLDGDGLDDATDTDPLPNPDSDGDGIDDSKDLDSDNDGTPDITEAGGIDADGDGVLDDLTDTDGDGFGDVVDTNDDTVPGDGDGGTALTNPDTDGDGVDDRLDLDSDNDGIADVIENGGTDADGDGILDDFADVDGDGFSDIVDTDDNTVPGAGDGGTTLPNGDFDMDGIPNNLDLDSDNDGIVDVIEGGGTDVDGNGVLDDFTDVDGDGFSDVVDTDDNTVLGTGDGGTALPLPNTDGEGGANYLDIDADGDGIIDNIEGQTTADYIAPTGTDSDGDGIDDAYDIDESGTPIVPNNHDGDVNADYVDTDSDNDGESDLIEGHDLDGDGVADTTPSGDDTDNDGLDDAFDTTVLTDLTAGTNGGNGTVDPFTDGVLADADTPGAGNLDFREVDTDGDGVDDSVDLDSDNDGIPDVAEGDGDTDGDGIPDYLDLDSDNDGIPDIIEAGGTDNDGDGLLDVFEDLDGDGLDDATDADPLPNPDSDGDGIDDTKDLDSDNDGTPDITEAGGTDVDGDGILDDLTDTDGDGFGDIVDTDDNTIPGGGDGGISLANPDTDSDGVDDRIDLDSDNDGIADVIENGGTDADGDGVLDDFADVDGDGFSDVVDTDDNTVPGAGDGGTTLPNGDFDMDGIPNNLDLDSDNDGIVDAIEGGGTDVDGNGVLDDFTDVDGDGFSDVVDTDDNTVLGAGDGGTALPLPNTDGEGGANYLDIDADGDGIIDNIEGQATADYIAPTGTDSDGDGIDNAYDIDESGTPIVPNNHDGDANADYVDSDSDNDGESDLLEGHDLDGDGVADTTPSGDDTDGDGLDDAFDTIELTDLTAGINGGNGTVDPFTDGVLADADAPGIGNLDFRELDSDGDGIDDLVDLDDDNDGIPDDIEGDGDTDGDGIPDSIDLDSDNDGIPDLVEAGGTDSNGDGVLDVFEDLDGDGLDDDLADTPLTNPDSDGDGIVDAKDLDSDNDGTPDITEAGGIDADGDGVLDDITDTDGDGFADVVDTNDDTVPGEGDGGIALTNPDTDGDGVDDRLDLDSDNDGIADVIENGGTDADGDGVLDDFADVDGDGFSDVVDTDDNTVPGAGDGGTTLPNGDFDMDGIPNNLDLDSDNDGIVDAIEGGGTDADGDGILDDFADVDGDGFSDVVDTDDNTAPGAGDGGTALPLPNTDGEGGANYVDIDADGDGIIDNIEGQATADYIAPTGTDSDGDGIDDAYDLDESGTPIVPNNHDGDAEPDYVDLDSDNDGESDLIEGHDLDGDGVADTVPSGDDTDNDGLDDAFDDVILSDATAGINGGNRTEDPLTDGTLADADAPGIGDLDFRENLVDTDGDGIVDIADLDDDNDGIPDAVEDLDLDGDGDPYTNPTDTDGDGIIDIWDLDADNDGISDIIEAGGEDANGDGKVDDINEDGTLVNDTDGDGLDDLYDADNGGTDIINPDTDGDGNSNFQDVDSDNDGIFDIIEDGGIDADNDGHVDDFTDENGDGWDDNNVTDGSEDTDGDGVSDYLDLDSDNDGTADIIEDGGIDTDGDGRIDDFVDADGDGADDDDMTDGLLDTDGDGVPDHEDLDSDNDGITDTEENGQNDTDGDGVIDDFTDEDGDGWDDNNQTTDPIDTDGDGNPDYTDSDSDNDGIDDIIEGGGTDTDSDGVIDDFIDENGDGLDDNTGGITPPDTDGDGIDDYKDEDSDNDGVPDDVENDPNGDGTGPDDTDGDGINDYLDTDDDNDGIPTSEESDTDEFGDYTDCDGDNIPDYLDADVCTEETGVIAPTGFSPNGDGKNDTFIVLGIEDMENVSVIIFNRWGSKVFASSDYQNDWDGTNQFGLNVGDQLPPGTYFYVIDLGDGSEIIKNYIYLER